MGKKNKVRAKKNVIVKQNAPSKLRRRTQSAFLPWLLLLVGITAIVFSPMLKNGFTNWDDEYYVVNNALLRGPDWTGIFTQAVVSNFHPITILSLAFNYALSGTNAWSYLFLNLLLHLINTVLVFIFIYRISNQKTVVAFLTAIIFAVHPLHVESVAWISERKDVLYTMFFTLSLMQYWRFIKSGQSKRLWLSFLFFVLSILSKPAAIVLPLVLFLLDYWNGRLFSKKVILEKIPFFIVAAVFTVITLKLQSVTAMTTLDIYPLWVRFLFACYVIMIYLLRFFIPYPLSAFHPIPPPNDLGWEVYIAPLFVITLISLAWYFRKNKLIMFGLLFFFINILLVLQLIPIGFTIVSERYTYVPYIGLAFVTGMLTEKYFVEKKRYAWGLVVLVLGYFGFLSLERTKVWKDSDSLWSDVIKHYPTTSMPRGERAQFNYNKAIQMQPGEPATSLFQRVIEDCTVAINKGKETSKVTKQKEGTSMYYMRGIAYASTSKFENAFEDFNHCIQLDSNYAEALYNRGTLLVNFYRKYPEALKDFNRAIENSQEGKYYLNRSICYYKLGDISNAKADGQIALQKGVALPDNYRKLLNL